MYMSFVESAHFLLDLAFLGLLAFLVAGLLRVFLAGVAELLLAVVALTGAVVATGAVADDVADFDLVARFAGLFFALLAPAAFFLVDAAFFFGLLALVPAAFGFAAALDFGLAVRAVLVFLAPVADFFFARDFEAVLAAELAAGAAVAAATGAATALTEVAVVVVFLVVFFFATALFAAEGERFRF